MRTAVLGCLCAIALHAAPLSAQSNNFCQGFEDGWKSIYGDFAIAPMCPMEPLTPIGSTPYREGYRAGAASARRSTRALTPEATTRDGQTFCDGFEQGWKTIKGDLSIVPICPIAPITPVGSTSYREGLKAGLAAARRSDLPRSIGAPTADTSKTFCDGFEEGWRMIKGDLAIVPTCPIEPITPIGSTPYREGLKAGIARARR